MGVMYLVQIIVSPSAVMTNGRTIRSTNLLSKIFFQFLTKAIISLVSPVALSSCKYSGQKLCSVLNTPCYFMESGM